MHERDKLERILREQPGTYPRYERGQAAAPAPDSPARPSGDRTARIGVVLAIAIAVAAFIFAGVTQVMVLVS